MTAVPAEVDADEADEAGEAVGTAFDLDLPVPLHALTYLDEGEEVTVGRRDTDEYCVLPADGAALLRELEKGATPNAAAAWYQSTYGESVDMAEFLAAMEELEFIAPLGQAPAAPETVRWQRLGKAAFSVPAWIGYGALLAAGVYAMVRHPDLAPRYKHLFFTQYLTVVLLVGFFGQLPLILLHEWFHVLAGRRLGLKSSLGVGRRLYFVVVETTLGGLVSVPRRKRYLPMLAGMLADLLIIAALTLLALAVRRPDGSVPLFGGVCLGMAFAVVPRFLWQFYFYLQTDLYQVAVTVLGCVDLQRTARRVISNRFRRLLGRTPRYDEGEFHPRDRQAARWYSWLLVVGYGFSLGTLALAVLPTVWTALRQVADRLAHGSFGAGLDSVVFIVFTAGQLGVAGWLAIRQRRANRAARPAAHVID